MTQTTSSCGNEELNEKRKAFSLNYGEKALYRGKAYPIVPRSGNRIGFDALCFSIPPNLPPEGVKATEGAQRHDKRTKLEVDWEVASEEAELNMPIQESSAQELVNPQYEQLTLFD